MTTAAPIKRPANWPIVVLSLAMIAASLGFVAAQPRFFKAFCEWTGIYDIDRADKLTHSTRAARPVRLEFDANNHGDGLRFTPETHVLEGSTGTIVNVMYRIENMRNEPVIGQAVPSYGPLQAGAYVKKLDCFCFKQQTFAPREVRMMPVVFVLDPEIPDDVRTVTLSYTFFEIPAGSVQSAPAPGKGAI